ncbi:MAG TPA: hypothetical protein VEJ18_00280 [Planctomycetota bacterium]|nr:hypothetical protein [Planctomycetota bacterium]
MGKAIVYCGSCGKGLLEEDFERGKAVRSASQSFCTRCSPIDVAALPAQTPARPTVLPPQTPARATALPKSTTTTRIPRVSTGRIPTVASTRRIKTASGSAVSPALWVGLGALLGLLVLGLWVALSRSPRPSPSAVPPARDERPSPPARALAPKAAPSVPPTRAPAPASAVEEQKRR